jgi:hypothetical protein
MSASTAPQAKANLLDQLAARSGLAGVRFNWSASMHAEDYVGGENIYLGNVRNKQEWGAIRRTTLPKNEEYILYIFAQVHRLGDDPQGTEERAWELISEIEGTLRADPTIGGVDNREGASLVQVDMSTRPAEPQGWLAKATAQISCHARI